ncbi:MAG: VCBS repeat-containing protein [Bacteroidales bacterium]|nr:VCBS repeat-containing protein [Bacteroidales bacterium]
MTPFTSNKFIIISILLFIAPAISIGQYFNETDATFYPVMNCSGSWIDMDDDGDLDLLLSGERYASPKMAKETRLYDNIDRKENFKAIASRLTDLGYSATDVSDYDNDGDLDFIVAGEDVSGNPTTILYRNNRNNSFTRMNIPFIGVKKGSVCFGDYDRDGNPDVAICGEMATGQLITKIYQNQKNNFRAINAEIIGVKEGALDWGDYDNDGDLDLLICGETNTAKATTRIYRNDGRNTFQNISAPLSGVKLADANWGDFDHDGLLDIVLSGESNDNTIIARVYRNLGNNNFINKHASIDGLRSGSVDWGDFDHDGDLDILMTGEGYNNNIKSVIYRNDREKGFVDIAADLVNVYYSDGKWGDYDNDGDLDLFIAGLTQDYKFYTKIYRNDGILITREEERHRKSIWTEVNLPQDRFKESYFFLISSCFCRPDSSFITKDYHVYYSEVFKLSSPYRKSMRYYDELIMHNDNWAGIKEAHFSKGYESYEDAERTRQQMLKSYRQEKYKLHFVQWLIGKRN